MALTGGGFVTGRMQSVGLAYMASDWSPWLPAEEPSGTSGSGMRVIGGG